MYNFTHNNHLQYSIGNTVFGERTKSIEQYSVEVGPVTHDLNNYHSWYDESKRVAELVYNDLGKELCVFVSGGTDSEIVLRSFVDIGVKPTCFTIALEGGYNKEDVILAIDLCNSLNVEHHILPFDVLDYFYSGRASELSQAIQCTQITYLMVYQAIHNIGLPSVMGGELLLRKQVTPSQPCEWYFCFRENEDASAMRFSNKYHIPLVNEWFSYTPEFMALYLLDDGIQNLVKNQNYKLSSVSSKNVILKQLVPNVEYRQKTHGFERLLGFNVETFALLKQQIVRRLEPSIDGIMLLELNNMLGVNLL